MYLYNSVNQYNDHGFIGELVIEHVSDGVNHTLCGSPLALMVRSSAPLRSALMCIECSERRAALDRAAKYYASHPEYSDVEDYDHEFVPIVE